jgi:UDP-N-acetylglucosamine--dolichyl-phosphate N-acetylglucosaminephosphotransferase
MAYAGGTSIIIPKPLTPYVGLTVLELGMCIRLKQVESVYLLFGGCSTCVCFFAVIQPGDNYRNPQA